MKNFFLTDAKVKRIIEMCNRIMFFNIKITLKIIKSTEILSQYQSKSVVITQNPPLSVPTV